MFIRLASSSPRRLELLKQINWQVEVCQNNFIEISGKDNTARSVVETNAFGKGESVARILGTDIPIVAADTVVVIKEEILGKPQNAIEATLMLKKLSGNTHSVLTGVVVFYQEKHLLMLEETKVHFRDLSDDEIEKYIATGEPFDKAGAYGIQGQGAVFVQEINGCYNNVVGLPLTRLYLMMAQIGVEGFEPKN